MVFVKGKNSKLAIIIYYSAIKRRKYYVYGNWINLQTPCTKRASEFHRQVHGILHNSGSASRKPDF